MIDKPISALNAVVGGMLPLDPNTLIEIAWPDVGSPTGYSSFKCTLAQLNSSLASGGALFTAEDASTIAAADQDNGHEFAALNKLRADVVCKTGFKRGFK